MYLKEFYYRWKRFLIPIPVLASLIALILLIYILTLFIEPLYDILELKYHNILSPITSIFIHNLNDQANHITSNIITLSIFGYIASVQSSWKRMLLIFIGSGFLTNIGVLIFVYQVNLLLSPQYIEWFESQGGTVVGEMNILGVSGGGASDGIAGLVGFSLALTVYYFIGKINISKSTDYSIKTIKTYIDENWIIIFINSMILLLGTIIVIERFFADLEMFSYVLTNNFAFISGSALPFPQSRGVPTLAHVIGSILGFILGLWYLIGKEKQSEL